MYPIKNYTGITRTDDGSYRKKRNHELYRKMENISHTMRKRRVVFFGHVYRTGPGRLPNRIMKLFRIRERTVHL